MSYIDLNKPVKIHFIGIGGISMSGLAELLNNKGFRVSGSDRQKSAITLRLESLGITVYYGNRASNINPDTDAVVYTAAVKEDNCELMAARSLGIHVMDRAELIGELSLHYKNNICIAGTHGKTTTTSMLSLIMLEAELDPTISVGGVFNAIQGNIRDGSSDNFIMEACEYTDSFLKFHPTHAIILNIEAEHLDYFKTLENERKSFRKFANMLPENGLLVINNDIPSTEELFNSVKCPVITYSLTDGDFTAKNISYNEYGYGQYTLVHKGTDIGEIVLNVLGEHNISNSLGAAALAYSMGINFEIIASSLYKFTGTGRRQEKKGVVCGVTVMDDYAHHPTEIKATLNAVSLYPHNTLWCVFQPHTYSRTKQFLNEICEALSYADKIILTDIYAAREINDGSISSNDICEILSGKYGKDVYYFSSFNDITDLLLQKCCPDDLLITMGAGDVVSISNSLVGK